MKLRKTAYHGQTAPLVKTFHQGLLVFLLLFSWLNHSQGQVTSEKGWVRATTNKGCVDFTISLTHQRAGGGELFYSFEGNAENPVASNVGGSFELGDNVSYTYESPGTFTIIIIDQANGLADADRIDRLEITAIPDDPPKTSVISCQGRSILINFDKANDPFDEYSILFGDGKQQTFSGDVPVNYTYAAAGTYEVLIQGLLNDGESSSCKLAKHAVSAFDQLPIPQLNSLLINDSETITFNYESLHSGLQYYLEIDRGSGFEDLDDIDALTETNSFQYSSSDLNFRDTDYRFRMRVEDICGSFKEYSSIGNTIAFAIELSEVTNEITILLSWSTSTEGFTNLNFLSNDQLLSTFDQSTRTDFTHTITNCLDLGDFTLEGTFNGVQSKSILINLFTTEPLILPAPAPPEAEMLGANVNLVLPTTDFKPSLYQIYRKDIEDQFNLLSNTPGSTFTDATIPPGTNEVCYFILYQDECGNSSDQSEEVCVTLGSSLGIPNAFSPNNDGINDVFKVRDANYLSFAMEIFNRWGNLVFRSSDPAEGWNGDFEGTPSPAGSYTYRISFQGTDKVPFTRAGSFLLIR